MDLNAVFDDRLQEIEAYLDFLDALEQQVRLGPPRIGGAAITSQQQKILYSSVYLQLYNLVEATATWCIEAVTVATADGARWKPADLDQQVRREWVRHIARTHVDLTYEHRLESAVELCNKLVDALPLAAWNLEKGGGGNWDDSELEQIAGRLGFQLRVSQPVYTAIKRKVRDDKSALVLVKYLRNRLAHGTLSFAECGDGVTVHDLREMKNVTALYLREVIGAFTLFINNTEFIRPERRPVGGAHP